MATRLPFISPYRKASLPFAPVFINHDGCVMFHRPRNENNSCGIHFVALIWAESAKLGTRDERNSGYFHFVAEGRRTSGHSLTPDIGKGQSLKVKGGLLSFYKLLQFYCIFN